MCFDREFENFELTNKVSKMEKFVYTLNRYIQRYPKALERMENISNRLGKSGCTDKHTIILATVVEIMEEWEEAKEKNEEIQSNQTKLSDNGQAER